jgi:hypothetical protein
MCNQWTEQRARGEGPGSLAEWFPRIPLSQGLGGHRVLCDVDNQKTTGFNG